MYHVGENGPGEGGICISPTSSPAYIPSSFSVSSVTNPPPPPPLSSTQTYITTSTIPSATPMHVSATLNMSTPPYRRVEDLDIEPKRRVTDVKWLVVFMVTIMTSIIILMVSLSSGDPYRLSHGVNYQGKICGIDDDVVNLPFLYYPLDPRESYASMMTNDGRCLQRCPNEEDVEKSMTVGVGVRETMINESKTSLVTTEFIIQSPVYSSFPLAQAICIPNDDHLRSQLSSSLSRSSIFSTSLTASLLSGLFFSSVPDPSTSLSAPSSPQSITSSSESSSSGKLSYNLWTSSQASLFTSSSSLTAFQHTLGSFHNAWLCICGYTLLSIIFAFAFSLLLRISPTIILPSTAVGGCILSIIFGSTLMSTGFNGVSDDEKGMFHSSDHNLAVLVGMIFIGLAVISFFILFVARRLIMTACRVLECAGDVIFDTLQIYLAPFIFSGATFLFMWFWLWAYMYIWSSGYIDIQEINGNLDPNGDVSILPLHRPLIYSGFSFFLSLIWILTLVIMLEMFLCICIFIISYTSTVWIFSPPEGSEERDVGWYPSLIALGLGVYHHMGSFFVGSLVMSLSRPIRYCCFFAKDKYNPQHYMISSNININSASGCSPCGRGGGAYNQGVYTFHPNRFMYIHLYNIIQTLRNCTYQFLPFLSFITDRFTSSGFIEMSISSKPFFVAMDKSSGRLLHSRSPASFFHGISSVCTVIGSSTVAVMIGFLTYTTLTGSEKYSDLESPHFVSSPLCISLFTLIISGVCTSFFTSLWDVTADALMYCFLVEAVQPPVVDENPMTKIHAPACVRELLLDAQQSEDF